MSDDTEPRILDDDELIVLNETRRIMGGISVSTSYEDPELQRLKIKMTSPERKTKCVRWIRREVLALRAERVANAEANADDVVANVRGRIERRRIKQRERAIAKAAAIRPQPKPVIKPRKVRLRPRTKAEKLPR